MYVFYFIYTEDKFETNYHFIQNYTYSKAIKQFTRNLFYISD